jgi:hypothetical protein
MAQRRYVELFDEKAKRTGDVEIISEASWDHPGLLIVAQATVDPSILEVVPAAPLISRAGGKIGIVFAEEHLIAPFLNTYLIAQPVAELKSN